MGDHSASSGTSGSLPSTRSESAVDPLKEDSKQLRKLRDLVNRLPTRPKLLIEFAYNLHEGNYEFNEVHLSFIKEMLDVLVDKYDSCSARLEKNKTKPTAGGVVDTQMEGTGEGRSSASERPWTLDDDVSRLKSAVDNFGATVLALEMSVLSLHNLLQQKQLPKAKDDKERDDNKLEIASRELTSGHRVESLESKKATEKFTTESGTSSSTDYESIEQQHLATFDTTSWHADVGTSGRTGRHGYGRVYNKNKPKPRPKPPGYVNPYANMWPTNPFILGNDRYRKSRRDDDN